MPAEIVASFRWRRRDRPHDAVLFASMNSSSANVPASLVKRLRRSLMTGSPEGAWARSSPWPSSLTSWRAEAVARHTAGKGAERHRSAGGESWRRCRPRKSPTSSSRRKPFERGLEVADVGAQGLALAQQTVAVGLDVGDPLVVVRGGVRLGEVAGVRFGQRRRGHRRARFARKWTSCPLLRRPQRLHAVGDQPGAVLPGLGSRLGDQRRCAQGFQLRAAQAVEKSAYHCAFQPGRRRRPLGTRNSSSSRRVSRCGRTKRSPRRWSRSGIASGRRRSSPSP